MRKTVLALLGAALMAGATTGTAYSKQRHQGCTEKSENDLTHGFLLF